MAGISNADREKFEVPSREQDKDKFQIFEKWLLDNGAKFPSLELKDYGDEVRGVHATADIPPDEVIMEIPLKCLITVEMGKDTAVGQKILQSNISLDAPKHIFLMLFMLIDRQNPNSFFKPYYDILPKTLHNMPIFWTEEELRYLQGSYLLTQIDERKLAISTDYRNICRIAPEFADVCTEEEFAWARMCVCSRNFGLVVHGLRTAALVPYADMLNHYRPRETKWEFEDNRNAFTITSLEQLQSGAQVYDSYGQKCNHRFLLNYGFSIENNVEAEGFCPNEVPILLSLADSDRLRDRKVHLYGGDGSLPVKRLRVCVTDGEPFKAMMAMLRIIVADDEDLRMLLAGSGHSVYRSMREAHYPINLKNEIAALQKLLDMMVEYQSRYPSTLEEDIELLASKQLAPFSNHRHAVIQVRGEKEVLRFYENLARVSLDYLKRRIDEDIDTSSLFSDHHFLIAKFIQNSVVHVRRDERRRQQMLQKQIDLSKPTIV